MIRSRSGYRSVNVFSLARRELQATDLTGDPASRAMLPVEQLTLPVLEGASCRDVDPEIFWETRQVGRPYGGATRIYAAEKQAKALCRKCPVLEQCRAFIDDWEATHAMAPGNDGGIWAGETPAERKARRLRERRAS